MFSYWHQFKHSGPSEIVNFKLYIAVIGTNQAFFLTGYFIDLSQATENNSTEKH